MSIINIRCIDQTLTVTNAPLISSGNIQTDIVKFEFCPMWDEFKKTAIFYKDESEVYAVLVNQNNEATVPKEVLQNEGLFYFGVHGVSGDKVKTSQVLRYRVVKGAISEDVMIPDPTPDIYSQIMKMIEEAGILIYYATEEQISQLLQSSAQGDGLITLTRLNQFNQGIALRMDSMMEDTSEEYGYEGD